MSDYALGSTFDIKFSTRRFSTGAPFTLGGTPAVAAYPDNSTTEITAGLTLSVDFDGVTGLHNIRVVASSGNGYAAGSTYALVLTAGTVDSVSVVGEAVGEFTLERSSAFGRLGAPAGASVSADIAAAKAVADAILVDTGTTLDGKIDSILEDTGTTLDAKITAIDDFLDTEIAAILAAVDTEIAAIKDKTDLLTFNAANQLLIDLRRINNTPVNGDGAGTPWGP